jgi:hypothetical protein
MENNMASRGQVTGMRGVYLVAAELSRLGFVVSVTSRGAAGADLLVTDDQCRSAFSVQVKTNGKNTNFWLVGQAATQPKSKSHVYVLVNISDKAESSSVDYYVVPSAVVAKHTVKYVRPNSTFFAVAKDAVQKYRSKWSVFGSTSDASD